MTKPRRAPLYHKIPLLEFDAHSASVTPPNRKNKPRDFPQRGVLCFFQDVIRRLYRKKKLILIDRQKSEMGHQPVYKLKHAGQWVTVMHPGVGAPLAAGSLEELIARGTTKLIAVGGVGVLDHTSPMGKALVLRDALRDEGTSYHYLKASRTVAATPKAVQAIVRSLKREGVPYQVCRTWTTDAFYRETVDKIKLRRGRDACLVVDMEAAATFAVARFRKATFGQLAYAGDLVHENGREHRGWDRKYEVRESLFWLALRASLLL